MKLLLSLILTISVSGTLSFASEKEHDHKSDHHDTATVASKDEPTKQKKKERKKKALMCSECGKPESECECHGHK